MMAGRHLGNLLGALSQRPQPGLVSEIRPRDDGIDDARDQRAVGVLGRRRVIVGSLVRTT